MATSSASSITSSSANEHKQDVIVLKTSTADRENPLLYTVCDLFKSADLYEREVFDFFGIRFINHPDMRRIFLRSDWKGFPFRKDDDPSVNAVPCTNVTPNDLENVPSITIDSDGNVTEGQDAVRQQRICGQLRSSASCHTVCCIFAYRLTARL